MDATELECAPDLVLRRYAKRIFGSVALAWYIIATMAWLKTIVDNRSCSAIVSTVSFADMLLGYYRYTNRATLTPEHTLKPDYTTFLF